MTVYADVLNRHPFYQRGRTGRHQAILIKIEHTPVFRLNLILLLIAAIAIVAYVFISNLLVAQKYVLNLRKSEFNQLNAKSTAKDQHSGGEDLMALLRFAQNSGLVEAKDIDSISEKDGLAIFNR